MVIAQAFQRPLVMRKRTGAGLATPSPGPPRLKKAPARATLSPKGERAQGQKYLSSNVKVLEGVNPVLTSFVPTNPGCPPSVGNYP